MHGRPEPARRAGDLASRDERLVEVRPDVAGYWPDGVPPMLDAGELTAIALARDLGCPVLMDERLGRQVARRYGVPVIGSAGILLAEWKQWGYVLAPIA